MVAQKFGNGRWVKEGFLDNRVPDTVVGRIVFAALGPVEFYLQGNFKADIAGQLIEFRNDRYEDEDLAAQVIADMDNPQIGRVNLISFDPHPNLMPHPYVEWFSGRSDHYRFELTPGEAWIVPPSDCGRFDAVSRQIRHTLAGRATDHSRKRRDDSDWI